MKNIYYHIFPLLFFTFLNYSYADAAVTVGTGSANNLCVETVYTGIGNITITENLTTDIAPGTNVTFNLNLPAGFQFNTASGNVMASVGDISSINGAFTSNTNYRVTLTVSTSTNLDIITISGLQIRATAFGISANITRFNGSAVINGFEEGIIAASISSGNVPVININPSNKEICATGNTSFNVNASGTILNYQWQVDNGGGWTNITEASPYSNTTSATLNISNAPTTLNGYQYRCVITEAGECSINTTPATLTVNPLPINSMSVTAFNSYLCHGTGTNIILGTSQSGVEYQLKNGAVNIGSPVTGTGGSINLPTGNLTATAVFSVEARNMTTGCSQTLSNTATVNVNNPLSVNATADDNTLCSGSSTSLTASASGGSGAYTYSWSPSAGLDNTLIATPFFTSGTVGLTNFTITVNDANPNYTTCAATDQVSVTVNALPIAGLTVSAQEPNLCYNNSTLIIVESSMVGVSYQLKNGTTNIGSPVSGTGANISLPTGNLTSTATFSVQATNSTTGCTILLSNTALVTVNNALSVIASVTDNSICGNESTNLSALASGGTGTYTYSWDPPGGLSSATIANPTFTPPSSGNYTFTVTVTDAGAGFTNCDITDQVAVTVNSLPIGGLPVSAQTANVCYNASTNIIVGSSQTGVSYQLKNGTTNIGSPVSGTGGNILLPTGNLTSTTTFSVQATNNTTGCTVLLGSTAQVNVNNALSVDASVTDNIICGDGSTDLSALASGGTGTYTYSWSPPAGLSNVNIANPTFTPPAPGPYTFTVTATDAGAGFTNCSTIDQVTITVNSIPIAGLTVNALDPTLCYNTSTNIVVESTQMGVSYQLKSGTTNIGSPVAGTGGSINLPTGNLTSTTTFSVQATNSTTGCTILLGNTALVTVNNALSVNASVTDNIICGDGSTDLSALASGGTGTYTYSWSPPAGLSNVNIANPTFTPPAPGPYTFTVTATDAGAGFTNCSTIDQVTITVNSIPIAGLTVNALDPTLCYNTSTNIVVESTQMGVSYQLKSGTTNIGSPVAGTGGNINLPTGNLTSTTTFSVQATNNTTGCTVLLGSTALVTVNNALSVNASVTDNIICGDGSTDLSALASGGTGTYTYSWNPPAGLSNVNIANPTFTPPASGTYTFTVTATDAGAGFTNCSTTDQVAVNVNSLPIAVLPVSAQTANICYNTSTDIIVGSSQAGVSYQLKSGTTNIGSPVAGTGGSINLPTGNLTATTTFSVQAINSTTGCMILLSNTALVTVNNALSVDASVTDNIICGDGSTDLSALASGGTGTYTYSWSPPAGLSNVNIANPTFTPPASGIYTFTVTATDAGFTACSATDQVSITVNELPTVDAGTNLTICENTSTQIGNPASGGLAPYTYSWSPSATLDNASAAQPFASPLVNTNYNVVITDANGCQNSDMIAVAVTPAPVANAGSDEVICEAIDFNFSTQNIAASVSNHSTYFWTSDGSGAIINDNTLTPTYQPAIGETGIITFTLTVNGNGTCTPVQDQMVLTINPTPDFTITNNQPVICDDNSIDLDVFSPDPNAIITLNAVNNAGGSITGHNPVGTTFLPGAKINSILSNNTTDTLDIIYSFGVQSLGCANSASQNVRVRVNPTPVFSVTNSLASICNGASTDILVNTPTEGGEVVLLDVNYGSAVGTLVNNLTFLDGVNINDQLINNTTAPTTVTYRFNVTANGCVSNQVDQVVTVKVYPEPKFSFTNNTLAICSGSTTDILLQSAYFPNNEINMEIIGISSNGNITGASPVGTQFVKGESIKDLLTNNSNVSDTLRYEIQISYNGICLGETDIIEVAVNPNPSVSAVVADPLICHNETTDIILSDPIGVAGSTFSWTASPESGITGATPGTGSNISQTLGNAAAPYSVKEVVYQISSQSPVGCVSNTIETVIEVNPELIADAGLDQNLCDGGTITIGGSPTARGGVGTYLYTWTGPADSDFVSSKNIANPNVEPGTLGISTYSVQVEDANNCFSNIDAVDIQISPEVVVNITTTDDFICSGDSASVLGEITGGATTGIWSTSGTGSFFYSNSTLDNIYIPSLADQTNGSVILTLTSADPAGPCTANASQVTIRISPAVIADAGDDVYICEGSFAQIGGDVSASGGSGFYTISWTGPDGFTSTASNPIVSPSTLGSNEYSLSVVDNKGCKSDDDIVTVFVNEKAIVNAGADYAVCESTQIDLTGNVSGGSSSGQWVVVLGNGTISANSSSAGVVTATYNTTPADYGNLVILDLIANDPDGTGPAGPCEIVSDRLVVTINSLPNPSILNLPLEIAVNADPITIFGDPTGGDFSGPGIIVGTNTFDPEQAGEGIRTITYTYTQPFTGCTNDVSQDITVNPLPDVRIVGLASTYCYDDNASVISGDPMGGVFSGPGITFGSGNFFFQPSTAGVGLHNISYQYTDENGVTVIIDQEVRVNASPRPQFSIDETQSCVTQDILFTDETTIPGAAVFSDAIATWNWNMNNGEAVYPEQNPVHNFASHGRTPVSLQVTTLYGCTFSTFREIVVGAVPDVDFDFINIAAGDFTEFTNATSLPNGAAAADGIDENTGYFWDFDFSGVTSSAKDTIIVFPGVGSYNVKLRANTIRGCVDSAKFVVEIIPLISTEFPYFEDFEDGRAGWTLGGTNISWELANPSGSVINTAASGSNSWVTNANGEYNPLEQSHVNSPAFDLSQLERPMLSLKIWVHPEPQRDGAVLQYSVNGGKDWLKLGTIGEGLEWYDYRGIISNPGGQDFATEGYEGWTDATNGWVEASYSLQALAEFEQVRFRIAFGSDERNPIESEYNGFAFDDFEIKDRTRLVLLEHFTNTSTNAAGDNHINNIEDALNPDQPGIPFSDEIPREVVSLRYHLNYPSSDPLFNDNTSDMSARREYYDFEVPLKTVVDGSNKYNPGGNTLNIETAMVVKNSLIDPKFRITATINETEVNELSVSTIIEALQEFTDRRIIVHLAVIERQVSFEGLQFRNVLKKLIPDAGGTEFLNDWNVGTTQSFTANWNLDDNYVPVYDPEKLGLIIFVQDRISKEVYQAQYVKLPPKEGNPTSVGDEVFLSLVNNMTLYPNPVTRNYFKLIFPQPLQKSFKYKIVDLRGVKLMDGILEAGKDQFEFETNELTKGINLLMIGNEDGEYHIRKFLVK